LENLVTSHACAASARRRRYRERISRRIVLIEGPTLARYMYDHGVGVRSERSLDVKAVDETYFEGEG
jgi:restriction system protein